MFLSRLDRNVGPSSHRVLDTGMISFLRLARPVPTMRDKMKKRIVVCFVFLVLLPISGVRSTSAQTQTSSTACCFVNPHYHGVCQVTPAQGETCDSILKYLNAPGTQGKTYCTNTQLRGGWKHVDCPAQQ
jgi:hypothetical protein